MQLTGLWEPLRPYAQAGLDWAARFGIRPEVTSVYRSWEEQQDLWQRYQAGLSEYPANPPGLSAHQYHLAWDSWVPDELMPWWVAVRRALGWQIYDNDPVHAELPGWTAYKQYMQ